MKILLNFWTKRLAVIFLLIAAGQSGLAQSWMQGYNFRKIITIDKTKVPGASNLFNFNLLIELESVEFTDLPDCNRTMQPGRLPVSFALKSKPDVPVGFEIDSYDPVSGKLICWLQIPELIAGSNPGVNEIYFYYGGNEAQEPSSEESNITWSMGYQRVWHMNFDAEPAISYNAVHNDGNTLIGNSGMNLVSFTKGVIGTGITFNGTTDAMSSATDTNKTVCISGWIKFRQPGSEQVILANDSAGNGYLLKINAQGKMVFDIIVMGTINSHVTVEVLPLDTWVYFVASFDGRLKRIYLNGLYKGGGFSTTPSKYAGSSISIARSKQDDRYFNGEMDELRIGNVERTIDWILTEFRNQLSPKTFITTSIQEVNPKPTTNVNEFTGANGTSNWNDDENWSFGHVPGIYANVVVKAGRQVQINPGNSISVNNLVLETGARLILGTDLQVNCTAQLEMSSSIILKEQVRLAFKNDVVNNGSISLDQHTGTLVFNGEQSLQSFSGTGVTTISHLEINQTLPLCTVLLNANIAVSKRLVLIKGTLNANDRLTLLANGYNNYAAVAPVDHLHQVRVVGNVNVQQFIDGNFSSPSTARGWWLLSSPVFQSEDGFREYNFSSLQQSIFITGPGGITNGFDSSPNNNSTVYTHNQALAGTLSQKYTGIANMNESVTLGKGFYVFSRGSRIAPNAFEQQIQQPPFSNPQAYVITTKGKLLIGELKLTLFNRNKGMVGDGFNLLGNPYASPISWGNLQKTNVMPFIWVFDPRNNAYLVTDDPGYMIHSGTGFFVKVSTGHSTGELTFTEASKYSGVSNLASNRISSIDSKSRLSVHDLRSELRVGLTKDGLLDEYVLIMQRDGNDGITDADAPKIGEGHLSLSGVTSDGTRLAIDERGIDTSKRIIQLFVKGFSSGTYALNLKGKFKNKAQIVLVDHYLDKQITIEEGGQLYSFDIDMGIRNTYGEKRFSLLIQPLESTKYRKDETDESILLYPNPISDVIYIKSKSLGWRNVKVSIRTITGQVLWSTELPSLEPGVPVQLPANQFIKGVYILQLIDQKNNKVVATFKMIKN